MNYYNQKTRITASAIGVLLGLSGIINHGIFEILQGNTPTNGVFIEAISEEYRFWIHGTEAAFTIIPNFLITGICAIIAGLSVIFWSLKYIHIKNGASVFLSLLILQTLVGGGIGYIILFVPTWAFATRINKPLHWWKKVLSAGLRNKLSKLWIYGLIATFVSWLAVMELGIWGYFPGQSDPDTILSVVFTFLFLSVILASFTFVCAIAGDLKKQRS